MESRNDNELELFWYGGRLENYNPSNQRRNILRDRNVGKGRKLEHKEVLK